MDMKVVILLLLAASFALSGCAKKGQAGNMSENLPYGLGTAGNASSGPQGGAEGSGDTNGNLSDLFIIDTDKPLGDEGLGTGTPSADK